MTRRKANIDEIRAAMRKNFEEVTANFERTTKADPSTIPFYRAQQLFFPASEEFTVAFVNADNECIPVDDIMEAATGAFASMIRNIVTNHSTPDEVMFNYLAMISEITQRLLALHSDSDTIAATAKTTVFGEDPH